MESTGHGATVERHLKRHEKLGNNILSIVFHNHAKDRMQYICSTPVYVSWVKIKISTFKFKTQVLLKCLKQNQNLKYNVLKLFCDGFYGIAKRLCSIFIV